MFFFLTKRRGLSPQHEEPWPFVFHNDRKTVQQLNSKSKDKRVRSSMQKSKKIKYTMSSNSVDMEWPAKAIPSFDSTLKAYSWPYGPGVLLEERSTMKQLLELAHSIRMPELNWAGFAGFYSSNGIGILGMRLSVDEAFVDSETKRNALVDRAHDLFNTTWKLEVQAMTIKGNVGVDQETRQTQQFIFYEKTEDHLYATVDKIDKLRSLYDNLKPETIDLVRRCSTTNEIRRSMIVPTEVCAFLYP